MVQQGQLFQLASRNGEGRWVPRGLPAASRVRPRYQSVGTSGGISSRTSSSRLGCSSRATMMEVTTPNAGPTTTHARSLRWRAIAPPSSQVT